MDPTTIASPPAPPPQLPGPRLLAGLLDPSQQQYVSAYDIQEEIPAPPPSVAVATAGAVAEPTVSTEEEEEEEEEELVQGGGGEPTELGELPRLITTSVGGQLCLNVAIPDLAKFSLHLRSSTHDPRGNGLFLPMHDPFCGIGIFPPSSRRMVASTGRIVSLGAATVEGMQLSLQKICVVLTRLLQQPVLYHHPVVNNVTQTAELGFPVSLDKIAKNKSLKETEVVRRPRFVGLGGGVQRYKRFVEASAKDPNFHNITLMDYVNRVMVKVFQSGALVFQLFRSRKINPLDLPVALRDTGYSRESENPAELTYEGVLQRIGSSLRDLYPILVQARVSSVAKK